MQPNRKILYIIILLTVSAFLFFHFRQGAPPGPAMQGPSVLINNHVIKVNIADEAEERRQGLSNREKLGEDEGMLFVFPNKQAQNFWMRNMRFPIDIIWIDDDTVVSISKNLPPEGETPVLTYGSGQPVNYVLEVNAGYADKYNIVVGNKVKILVD